VVHVAVDGHGGGNFVIALHAAYGHGHVMNHAESFAMIRKCMVKATPDVERDYCL